MSRRPIRIRSTRPSEHEVLARVAEYEAKASSDAANVLAVRSDVLARIGDDPEARFEFFKAFVALAERFVRHAPPAH